jgi:hypothetical protein
MTIFKKIDKVILETIILLAIGLSLYAVLTRAYEQGVNDPLYGTDLFALKKEAVDKYNTYLFSGLALAGFILQVAVTFNRGKIKNKIYSGKVYFVVFISGVAVFSFLSSGMVWLGTRLAKQEWLPRVIATQVDIYQVAKRIIINRGLRDDQLRLTDKRALQAVKNINFALVGKYLKQMDGVLELEEGSGDYNSRIRRLERYFEK